MNIYKLAAAISISAAIATPSLALTQAQRFLLGLPQPFVPPSARPPLYPFVFRPGVQPFFGYVITPAAPVVVVPPPVVKPPVVPPVVVMPITPKPVIVDADEHTPGHGKDADDFAKAKMPFWGYHK